jgi:hypothetical protein
VRILFEWSLHMLQPCCNRSRTHLDRAGKRRCKERPKTAYISEIFRQGSTYPESSALTYKEEVPGSSLGSLTITTVPFEGKYTLVLCVR